MLSRSRLVITLTEIDLDYFGYITNTKSHNYCFIIQCFQENNDKCIITPNTLYFRQVMFLHELDIALGNHASCTQLTNHQMCEQISE